MNFFELCGETFMNGHLAAEKDKSYGVKIVDGVRTLDVTKITDPKRLEEVMAFWQATQNRGSLVSDILNFQPDTK